jgi:hypothetical protein
MGDAEFGLCRTSLAKKEILPLVETAQQKVGTWFPRFPGRFTNFRSVERCGSKWFDLKISSQS